MQRNSLVICVYDFWREKEKYPHYEFPKVDDLLVVRGIAANFNGYTMLTFEELYLKLPIPLSSKGFVELQTPEEFEAIISALTKF